MEVNIKKELYTLCKESLQSKIDRLQDDMKDLKDAGSEVTKSSAGDKYETETAMIHLEREKFGNQLAEAYRLQSVLENISMDAKLDRVQTGSVVKTNAGNFFISIFLGKFEVESEMYFAISLGAPIGKALEGAKLGDVVSFRNKDYVIQELF